MTTAARPTFEPARGGRGKGEGDLSAMSKQYSSRDLPSHTKLKHRQSGQGTAEETKERDFRKELEEKEKIAKEKKTGGVPRDAGGRHGRMFVIYHIFLPVCLSACFSV